MKFACLVVNVSVRSIVLACVLLAPMLPSAAYAAATPPANTSITSSGLNTKVSVPTTLPNGKVNYDITGGTRPNNGPNLFHSFGEFSVATNHIANFLNETALPTNNIIGRINGGLVSNIWGTIQTTGFGAANLYLINPAGFIFGPTATLNVGGSFAASTADYLKMSDGAKFYADPVQPSVLSVANVAAFGFTNPQPVAISLEGSTLIVGTGQSISMIGGDFTMTNSVLQAPGGRVQIASVASPGEVVPSQTGQPAALDVSSFSQLGAVSEIGTGNTSSSISVSSLANPTVGAGTVLVRGNQITLNQGAINSTTLNADAASIGIDLQATQNISVTNSQIVTTAAGTGRAGDIRILTDMAQLNGSNVFSRSINSVTGDSGAVDVTARVLEVRNGTSLGTFTQAFGRAGNVTIHADNITTLDGGNIFTTGFGVGQGGNIDVTVKEFFGSATNLASVPGCAQCVTGILANTGFGSPGGSVHVQADTIRLLDGATIQSQLFSTGPGANIDVTAKNITLSGLVTVQSSSGPITQFSNIGSISSGSFATGTGGSIKVSAENLELANNGRIISTLLSGASGNAGNVTINTGTLNIHDRGTVAATSFLGSGNSGDIYVTAKTVNISGVKDSLNPGSVTDFTGISASTSVGRGGTVRVTADDLVVTNKGAISSTTFGSGSAGSIIITAGNVSVADAGFIVASTAGSGPGGNIDINAGHLTVSGEVQVPGALDAGVAVITAQANSGSGNAGTIKITANQIDVLNQGAVDSSTLTSGKGGNVELTSATIRVENGGQVSASSKAAGNAGSVTINTNELSVMSGGFIATSSTSTQANAGSAGNITIQGLQNAGTEADSVLVSGTNSLISTITAGPGQGGNIEVAAKQMQVEQLGRLSAETTGNGKAGNVTLSGDTLTVASGGRIEASTTGQGAGGSINVTTTGDVSVTGVSADGQTRSGLFAKTQTPSGTGNGAGGGGGGGAAKPGNAGNITITAKNLLLDSGAQIDSSTTSGGAGGSVAITTTENITIAGSDTRLTSDATRGDGNGGSITLLAKNIMVQDHASITAATGGKGNAGNISLTALDQLLLQSAGTVTTSTSGSGKGGTITIQAKAVLLDGPGTSITADTLRPFADLTITINILHPNDGDLIVQIDSPAGTRVALLSRVGGTGHDFINTGFSDQATQSITTGAAPFTGTFTPREPLGQLIKELVAGNWTLNVQDKATGNVGTLQNWTLQVGTQTFQSTGAPRAIPDNGTLRSTITVANPTATTVQGVGEAPGIGGDVTINAGSVIVQNGATVSATSRGSGKGGIVTVNATGPVSLSGPGSGLSTNAEASGAGGDINVTAANLTLDNGAAISAKSSSTGNAGTITINAGSEFLSTNGSVTTESLNASGGNITVLATDMVHLKNSQITASVQGGPQTTGGNIFIDPQFIILQNSQIIAQAFQGQGGNINIVANTFLPDASSLVSASSQFGLSGTVNIHSPVQNLSGALVPLKQSYLSGNTLSNQRCVARMAEGQVSTFVITEQDGLPQEPGGLLSSIPIEHDGGIALEPAKQLLVASMRPFSITPLAYEKQRVWTDESCRR